MIADKYLKYDIDSLIKEQGDIKVNGLVLPESLDTIRNSFTLYPHIVEDFFVALCVKGSAKIRIGLKEFEIKPGSLINILPQTMLEPIFATSDLQLKAIVFTIDFVSSLALTEDFDIATKIRNNPIFQLEESQYYIYQQYYYFISIQYGRKDLPGKRDILKYLLLALVSEIKDKYVNYSTDQLALTRSQQISNDFMDLLYKHYKQERNTQFFADKLNLSPKYLSTVIKEETGKPIMYWINASIITYAQSLLKASHLTISEIGYELNFSDSSQFCRFFKRYTGLSPNQYRMK